jgi:ABC-type sugar transport system ATPase subunit
MNADAQLTPHIELQGVDKNYGGVRAARDVSFSIRRGSIHALVGENGAGKSTVSKMIAGVVEPTGGRVLLDGAPVAFDSPRQALSAGIAIIDQELAMVPSRSVADNVFLGAESRTGGRIDARLHRKRFGKLLQQTGFDLDPNARVGTLRVADQQKVEIMRALAREAQLIIMDEPTAPLTQVESDQLYEIIAGLRDQGTTILYISHFLDEVLQISDTVTVMRDGQHVQTTPSADETQATLVRAMLGREVDLTFPEKRPVPADADPVLEVRDLSSAGRFANVSLSIRPGEIVGMAGLIGSGRTEVVRAIFGADARHAGEVLVDGRPVRPGSPRAAIARGINMLPESRKDDGLVMCRSISENTVLTDLPAVSRGGILRPAKERTAVDRLMGELDVRSSGSAALVSSLSGGNQQKVLFARCLMTNPRVLLVDEPTRGVDVGAKRAIYGLIAGLAERGMAVLVVSSELPEVLGLAHRVLVMRRGRLVADIPADDADEESVLSAAFGTQSASA